MTDHELMQLSEVVGLALKQRGATLTTAESCTGGWVAKAITDIAGSSAWFERGFVTYSNEAKAQMIGVREATLEQHGAVSEPVVIEMAIGALKEARADYAISISGIAGPDGGSDVKPVGTVWFGFATSKVKDHPPGMLQRRPRKRASSGNGIRVKNALATISTKYLILYDYTV